MDKEPFYSLKEYIWERCQMDEHDTNEIINYLYDLLVGEVEEMKKERIVRDVPVMFKGTDNSDNLKISGRNQALSEIKDMLKRVVKEE